MEREKFRLLAQKLGLKTGAEIEKRMEFEEQASQIEVESELDVGTEFRVYIK